MLLDVMARAGYKIDHLYEDGKELTDEILKRMTCDQRWLTPEEMASRSEASAGREVFTQWHEALPPEVREKMVSSWGEMPGNSLSTRIGFTLPGS